MNMNMKNEKTMLALIVVAALAMVSVAGVALASDQSDAASEVTSGSTYTVQDDTTNISVEITIAGSDNTTTFIVPTGLTYNGTVSIGTKDLSNVYTALYYVTFTNTTNVEVTITTTGTYTITQTSAGSAVDIEVGENTKVSLGNGNDYGFSGNITVGSTELTFANVYGDTFAIQNVNEHAVISGVLVLADGNEPVTTPAWDFEDDYYAYVSLGGTGTVYFKNTTVPSEVELIVGDNVTLMNYGSGDSGYADVTFSLNSSTATSISATGYAYAIDSQNNVVIGSVVTGGKTITFTGLNLSEKYNVYTATAPSTDQKYTSGIIDFTATNVYSESTATAFTITDLANGAAATTANIGYTGVTISSASIIVDGKIVSSIIDTSNSVIKFEVSVPADETPVNYPCMITYVKSGSAFEYIGFLTTTYSSDTAMTTAINATAKNALADEPLTYPGNTLTMLTKAKLTINGSIVLSKTYGEGMISLTAGTTETPACAVNFGENGSIKSDKLITATVTSSEPAWSGINGASYSKVITTDNVSKTIFYYTTLENAMTNSDNITVLGYLVITKDLDLTGTATIGKNKINFTGTLVVGNKDNAPVVTLLSTTTATYSNSTSVKVVNGQYVTVGSTNDYAQISADAFLKVTTDDGYNGVFTDLATALNNAVSGDTVALRQAVTLSNDATLSEGVTLDAKSTYGIEIKAGASLTLNGTAKLYTVVIDEKTAAGVTPVKDAGILTINTNNITFSKVSISGVVNVNSSDLTVTSGDYCITATNSKAPAVFNIAGKLTNTGATVSASAADVSYYVVYNVSGECTNSIIPLSGGNSDNIVSTMNVTGKYTATTSVGSVTEQIFKNMTVGINGSVTAKTGCTIEVQTKLTIGEETKDIAAYTNNATVVVTLVNNATAYVYGNFNEDNIAITAATSAEFIINGNVHCTIYEGGTHGILDYAPSFTNYNLIGWYSDEDLTTPAESTPTTVDGATYYAKIVGKTFTVTLTYVQNGYWVVNDDKVISGSSLLVYGDDNTLAFYAADGYTWDGSILVNDKEMPLGYVISAGDVLSVSADPVEKEEPAPGTDLVTILLVIITIVIVIMAIIIALKLMRS